MRGKGKNIDVVRDDKAFILITGIGGPAGRATATFLDEKKVPYIGVDMNKHVRKQYPGRFLPVPAANDPRFVYTLLQIAKERGIKLIIPTVDEEFIPLASNIKLFRSAGIKLIMSSLSTIKICRDKLSTANYLGRKGVPVPRTILLGVGNNGIKKLGLPLLVKPRNGRGARDITVFDSKLNLEKRIGKFDDRYILQEFIGGKEFDVNMFVHNGKVMVNKVLLKTKLEHGKYGNALKTVPARDKKVEEVAKKAALAIQAEGPIDLDVRKTMGGIPRVLEINPRIGANVLKAPDILVKLLKVAGLG